MINYDLIYKFLSTVDIQYIDMEQGIIQYRDTDDPDESVILPNIYITSDLQAFNQINTTLQQEFYDIDEIENLSLFNTISRNKYKVYNITIEFPLSKYTLAIPVIYSGDFDFNIEHTRVPMNSSYYEIFYINSQDNYYIIWNISGGKPIYFDCVFTKINNYIVADNILSAQVSDSYLYQNIIIIESSGNVLYHARLNENDNLKVLGRSKNIKIAENSIISVIITYDQNIDDFTKAKYITIDDNGVFEYDYSLNNPITFDDEYNKIYSNLYHNNFLITEAINDDTTQFYMFYILDGDDKEHYRLKCTKFTINHDDQEMNGEDVNISIDVDNLDSLDFLPKGGCNPPLFRMNYKDGYIYLVYVDQFIYYFIFKETDSGLSVVYYNKEMYAVSEQSTDIIYISHAFSKPEITDTYIKYYLITPMFIEIIVFDLQNKSVDSKRIQLSQIISFDIDTIYNSNKWNQTRSIKIAIDSNGYLLLSDENQDSRFKPTGVNIYQLQKVEIEWDQQTYNYSELPVILTGKVYIKDLVTNEYVDGNANLYVLGNDNYFDGHKTELTNVEITTDGYPIKVYVYNPDDLGLHGEVIIQEQS